MSRRRRGAHQTGGKLETVLAIIVLGAAVATFAPYAGAYAWWLDLFSHFRVHVTAAAVAIALIAIVLRRARWAVLAMMLVGANLLEIAPHVGEGAKAAPVGARMEARALKVVAFNAHFQRQEYASLTTFLRRENADIVVLLEIPVPRRGELESLRAVYPYWHFGQVGTFRGSEYPESPFPIGLVILSRQPWRDVDNLEPAVSSHPFGSRMTFDLAGGSLTIFAVHLAKPLYPENARMQVLELDFLARAVRAETDNGRQNIVIAGDMNLTPYAVRFRNFLRQTGMRRLDRGIAPTWPVTLGPFGIPIDHVLARGNVDGIFRPGPDTGSDHLPLIGTLEIGG